MKFCQECGKEMLDDQTICPNCGTHQTVLQREVGEVVLEQVEAAEPAVEASAEEIHDNIEAMALSDIAVGTPMADFKVGSGETVHAAEEQKNSINHSPQQSNNYSQQGGTYYYGPSTAYGQPNSNNQGMAYSYSGDPSGDSRFNVPGGGTSFKIGHYNFWLFLIITILTCGLGGLYFMYKWTEDANRLSQGVYKPSMNYLLVFLLGIVTCGIYPLVWTYQQGERLKVVGDANGIQINETGVHHLLLTLLLGGVGGIVSTYIFFSNTNRLASVYNGDMTRDQANRKTSHVPAIIVGVVLAILFGAIGIGTMIYQLRNVNYENLNGVVYDFNDIEDFDWDDWDIDDITSDMTSFGEAANFGDAGVKIMNAVKVKDSNGDPALAVTFSWGNYGDEKTSAMWIFDIEAYQDGQKLETTWPANGDKNVTMMENYSKNLKPGDETSFQLVFKLLNEDDDVQVSVEKLLSSSEEQAVCIFTL